MARKVVGGSGKAARRRMRKARSKITARLKHEFTFRGHTMEELQAMSVPDFAELLPSRLRRSIDRGASDELEKLYGDLRAGRRKVYRTHRRDVVILPFMVGKRFAVHSGKEYKEVEVQPDMLGHFIGEFALTRKSVKHTGPGVGATRSSKFLPLK
jgi:small subunit ribosomal protein S19